ncbi:MAG: hypothetical protein L0G99_04520 [Propionibacteriales bacterium]|nr:hypothetical protein [Propionibacteriales bacterium]
MHATVDPSDTLRQLALAQAGVISRGQAQQLGLSRHSQQRLVDRGRWQRLASGLLVAHDQPPTWTTHAWAGLLLAGDGARLGGEAAAHLWGLTDEPPERILVWHPHRTRRVDTAPWAFRREREDVRAESIGDPPRTSIEDTVLDLCDRRLGESELAPLHWLTVAVQKRLTSASMLRRTLSGRHRFGGRAEVQDLLADVRDGATSALELRYLRDVERAHGLPRGQRQAARRVDGRRTYRDVWYRAFAVVVELDGKLGHSGAGRFRDHRRDNAALMEGAAPLRYGWEDVSRRPCVVAREVAEMLTRGGWSHMAQRCARCDG